MGALYSRCVNCNSVCTENNHLLRVMSLGKRHDQVWCVDCFVTMRLSHINKINLKNYIDYINNKNDRES